jgi:hypothetical protein
MDDDSRNYTAALTRCYENLVKSRLVSQQETDTDALMYFQNACNKALPRTACETQIKNVVRELYRADKTGFKQCLNRAQHFVLLTEAKAIVYHFGLQELIYMEWTGEQFLVRKNTDYHQRKDKNKKRLTRPKRNTNLQNVEIENLNDRLARLELLIQSQSSEMQDQKL